MRREEVDYIVIIEGKARGAEFLRVRGEIQFSTHDSGLHLCGAVSAISESTENFCEIREEKEIHTRIRGEFLFQSQVTCAIAKVSFLQKFQLILLTPEEIGTGWQALHVVHDQIEIVQKMAGFLEKVGGQVTCPVFEQ